MIDVMHSLICETRRKMKIKTHEDLEVYQTAFKAAMEIFEK